MPSSTGRELLGLTARAAVAMADCKIIFSQDIFIVDNLLSVGSCKLEWFPL